MQRLHPKSKWWLIALIGVIIVTRLLWLDRVPAILNPDEASIGYNAYLLAETGRDEWDRPWPLILEAFGDQKVIGYTLLVVPLVKVFGFADWAVRFPAALSTILIPVLVGWLVWQWRKSWFYSITIITILAFQPVFIWYGRMAFEAMVALLYCLVLLTLGLKKSSPSLWRTLSVGLVILAACFTYNTPLVLIPGMLVIFPWWQGWRAWQKWLPMVLVGGVVWSLCVVTSLSLAEQKAQITLFDDETTRIEYGAYRSQLTGLSQKILGNWYVYLSTEVGTRFIKSFSPAYLIANYHGHPWHALPGYGYLTVTVYSLGWLGVVVTLRRFWQFRYQLNQVKAELLVVYLTLLGLAPAVITVNAPHATRSLLFFVGWGVLAMLGAGKVVQVMSKYLRRSWAVLAIGLLMLIPSARYVYALWIEYPRTAIMQRVLQPGLDTVVTDLEQRGGDEQVAVVDERGFSYVLVAWYAQLSPEEFRNSIVKQLPDRINFRYGERVGRYHFIAEPSDQRDEAFLVEWNHSEAKWTITP